MSKDTDKNDSFTISKVEDDKKEITSDIDVETKWKLVKPESFGYEIPKEKILDNLPDNISKEELLDLLLEDKLKQLSQREFKGFRNLKVPFPQKSDPMELSYYIKPATEDEDDFPAPDIAVKTTNAAKALGSYVVEVKKNNRRDPANTAMAYYDKSFKDKYKKENEEEYRRIVSILKTRRIRLGITQEEAGTKSGVSFANISAIERNVQSCSAVTLIGYIRAVDLDYAELDKNYNEKADKRNIISELRERLESLNEVEQRRVLDIVKAMYG